MGIECFTSCLASKNMVSGVLPVSFPITFFKATLASIIEVSSIPPKLIISLLASSLPQQAVFFVRFYLFFLFFIIFLFFLFIFIFYFLFFILFFF